MPPPYLNITILPPLLKKKYRPGGLAGSDSYP